MTISNCSASWAVCAGPVSGVWRPRAVAVPVAALVLLVLVSALSIGGALLVVTADLVARTALPVELPVGIVTAVLGAPYLLYLLTRRPA